MPERSFTLACVVDRDARFHAELVLWVRCVERYLSAQKFNVVVYFVENADPEMSDWLTVRGISVRVIEAVVPGSPHCNKIRPFMTNEATDYVIVADVDLFFVRNPSHFFGSDGIRAAPNNQTNPPGWVYREILAESGLGRPYRPGFALYPGWSGLRESHINNISAGIIGLPSFLAPTFAARWLHWAKWLVDRRELMRGWAIHVDQVAFSLAAEDIQRDVEFLSPQVNTILLSLNEMETIYAFHLTPGHIPQFPHLFNADKTMNADGLPEGARQSIALLNACIPEALADIAALPSARAFLGDFLNPAYER